MTHAVGDGAVRSVLDAYEFVEKQNGPRDRRWRIGHLEIVDPADRPRFAKHGIIAAFHPGAVIGRPVGDHVGKERLSAGLPWRDLIEPGAILSMGGDWPVESLNPFPIIQTGATRRTGKNAFFPNQALTLDHVLAGYTRNNAYTEFMEKQIGSLETGKLADLIVLSQDLYKIPAVQIGKTKVLLTMVDGRIVWWRGL